jgi:O-antigen ligase
MLAAAYLGLLTLVLLRVIPFGLVYETLGRSDEFFFRGESGLFYKGFLYLGIGFCFFLVGRGWSKLVAALLFATIVLTLTRGLVLSAVIVLAVALLVRARGALRLPAYGLLLATGVALAAPWLRKVFEVRATSDALRLGDVRVVEQSTTWASVLLGHGLGIAVGQRARIEATYLEILHQQGVLGLCFWGAIAALIMRDYLRAWKARRDDIALPFFLGAVFVYVESATNPFLTNPIGMSMVLVSLVVLRLLARGPASIGQPSARGQQNLAPAD